MIPAIMYSLNSLVKSFWSYAVVLGWWQNYQVQQLCVIVGTDMYALLLGLVARHGKFSYCSLAVYSTGQPDIYSRSSFWVPWQIQANLWASFLPGHWANPRSPTSTSFCILTLISVVAFFTSLQRNGNNMSTSHHKTVHELKVYNNVHFLVFDTSNQTLEKLQNCILHFFLFEYFV